MNAMLDQAHLEETLELVPEGFIFFDRTAGLFVGCGISLVEQYDDARIFTRGEAGMLEELFDEVFDACNLHVASCADYEAGHI